MGNWAQALAKRVEPFALACARRPWTTFAAFALIVALCGAFAATHMSVNTNSSDMLSRNLDFRARQATLNAAFPGLQDRLVVVVRAPNADAADAFLVHLEAAIARRPQALQHPFAAAVDPFFAKNGLLYMDDAKLDDTLARVTRAAPLIGALSTSPTAPTYFGALAQGLRDAGRIEGGEAALTAALGETAATIEARLAGKPAPLAWSRLFAPQEAAFVQRVLTVDPRLDFSRLQPARPAVDALRAAVAEANPAAMGVAVGVTGDPALRSEELGSVVQGLGASSVASILLIGALVWLAFRSVRRALVVAAVMVFAVAITAAVGAAVFPAFNLVSIGFAVLLVGMGADYATHTLLRGDEARAHGATGYEAAKESMDELILPLGLCAVCTALGFMAFVPTPFVGMAQLGILGAVGVTMAFLASITIVAAGITVVGPARAPATMPKFAWAARLERPAEWLVLALSIASLFALPFARFDADPMSLRDPGAPSVRAYEQLFAESSSQPYRASVLAPNLAAADALAARAKTVPGVDSAVTLTNLLPGEAALYRRDAITAAAFGVLPQIEGNVAPPPGGMAALRAELARRSDAPARRLAAALDRLARDPGAQAAVERDLFAYWPMRLAQLKAQLQPDAEITAATLPPALRDRFVNAAGEARVEIAPKADLRDRRARAEFVDALGAAIPEATGPVFTVEKSGAVVGKAMLVAFIGTVVVVSALLLLVGGDLLMTLATMLPVVAAAAITVAFGVLAGIPFNFANVIALPLMIGAGTDSAIHYAARAGELETVDHVGGTSTPFAILVSAFTTIASSGSLMLSPHRGVASIGIMLTVALTATVFTTLLLQPAAIRMVERYRARRVKAAATLGPI